MKSKIKAGMEVIGADGNSIGIVEAIRGERIQLRRRNDAASVHDRYVEIGYVVRVDGHEVHLSPHAQIDGL